MGNDTRVAKLLAPSVPLTLEVEGEDKPIKLDLKLCWNMRAVIAIETWLRTRFGQDLNILQNPGDFWSGMDCTKLALGVWACSFQEQPQYADEEGFEIIQSFMTADNYPEAMDGLRKAYLESLSKKKRDEVLAAIEAAKKNADKPVDPTSAPIQTSE